MSEEVEAKLSPYKVTCILTIQRDGEDTQILRTTCSDTFTQPLFEQLVLEQAAFMFPKEPVNGVSVLVHALSGYMNKFVELNPEDQGSKLLATTCENWLTHQAKAYWNSLSPEERILHAQAMHLLDVVKRHDILEKHVRKQIDEHTEQ